MKIYFALLTLILNFKIVDVVKAEETSVVPIRLGMLAPLVGDYAPYGQQVRKGIDIAVVEFETQRDLQHKKLSRCFRGI